MATVPAAIKWHGGKHYLAKRIAALAPAEYLHYVEPFAGGLSVLLALPPTGKSEVVNDLNGDLANFWSVLRDPEQFEEFKRLVEATEFGESVFEEAAAALARLNNEGDVERAWAFFTLCRQSRQGLLKDFATLSRSRVRRGMNEQVSSWLSSIEGLPAVHERLRRVVVLNRNALDVIRQQDGPDTWFYLDPPYLHETRSTTKEYGEEEMSDACHAGLLELLGRIEGKFALSGYESDLYCQVAEAFGWRQSRFDVPNHASSASSKERKIECVWTNYEPPKKENSDEVE